MATNYAEKYAQQVDEKFTQASITERAINKDYDFVGAKTVKVFSVPTVAMNDYQRSGANRYGMPSELENAVQEMTMSRDRAFTFTVDKGTDTDTDGQMNAGKALNRQIAEVMVPEVDAYRLTKMCRGAKTVQIGAYTGTGNAGAYERVLDAQAALDDALVPRSGRVLFVTSAFRKAIMLDDNFVKPSEMTSKVLMTGQFGEVDGLPIVLAPSGYLPSGVSLLLCHPSATTAPQKLSEYKTHIDPPGINGVLVEGRDYYDAFVLDNKKCALYALRGTLAALTVTSIAGSASGKTKVTVKGASDAIGLMGTLVYKAGASQAAPALGDDVSGWAALTEGTDITATNGQKIAVAIKDEGGKAIGGGVTTIVSAS
ncbi:MAG: N4-gp56 family major capsid protein [Clostridia bacterium]